MSKTGGPNTADWDVLCTHSNDERIREPSGTATWAIGESSESEGWRFARIQQTGRNQSGSNYSIALCGFEIYGKVSNHLYVVLFHF